MILERRGKIFVAAIIVGAVIAFTSMYIGANQQADILEEDIDIELLSVKLKSLDEDNGVMILDVTFEVSNNSGTVMTVGSIDYDLLADDSTICHGSKSYRDIPLVGRPQVFSHGTSGPIRTECKVKQSENTEIWNTIRNGDNMLWRTKGTAEIETSISVITREFDVWIQ